MDEPASEPQEHSEAPLKEHWLLDELSAAAQRKMDWASKIRDARTASDKALEKWLIQKAAKDLAIILKVKRKGQLFRFEPLR